MDVTEGVFVDIRWWNDSGGWHALLPDGSALETRTQHGLFCAVARRCASLGLHIRLIPAPFDLTS
jgi:hypothetical protein